MNTRMEKYDTVSNNSMSRASKNAELYKTINKSELDNYEIKSNATVLGGNNKNQIDVDQIKKILDTRYNETPKRRSIRLENPEEQPIKKEEITKEYDINVILEKARNDKVLSYEEDRVKKLRDTQFDILNNLDLKEETNETESEDKLINLINTITINEDKNRSTDSSGALDILSDLKGEDNTVVLTGMKEEIEEKENEGIISIDDIKKDPDKTTKLDNTYRTKSLSFDNKDFEDFGVENEKTSIWIKLLIVIVIIIFLVGVFFFAKSILNF